MVSSFVSWDICEKVLNVIKNNDGKPCPKNREIAEEIGVKNPDTVSVAITNLVDRGHLERFGTLRRREFLVVETGERTTKPVIVAKGVREKPVEGAAAEPSKPFVYPDVKLKSGNGAAWPSHWPTPPTARRAGL